MSKAHVSKWWVKPDSLCLGCRMYLLAPNRAYPVVLPTSPDILVCHSIEIWNNSHVYTELWIFDALEMRALIRTNLRRDFCISCSPLHRSQVMENLFKSDNKAKYRVSFTYLDIFAHKSEMLKSWFKNKLASAVDKIAISKIWKHYSLTHLLTDRQG